MDHLTVGKRSANMARIKSKNTTPELLVRKLLFANGLRYRLHVKDLPGKPDICIKKYNTVIDVRGCFWHSHDNCKLAAKPKTNKDYWEPKIQRNKDRDYANQKLLEELGFKVFIIWECETKNMSTLSNKIEEISFYLNTSF
tara:strand:+ start:2757 stop:3179 length:423 start_codon:yes stop_codon:yes gene_type:complete